jgi:hypothetical protein
MHEHLEFTGFTGENREMRSVGRRAILCCGAGFVLAQAGESRPLAGRWTARQPAARQRGRNAAVLEFTLGKDGAFRLDEVSRVGTPLSYVGTYRISPDQEFLLALTEAPEADGRFRAGEEINLGGILWVSDTRVRIGEFELVKRLD